MGKFTADIGRFSKQFGDKLDVVQRKVGLMAYSGVQKKTPVDSGALRRSWTVGKGQLPVNYGGDARALNDTKFGETLYIATDKPYAPVVEYGLYPKPGGHKTTNGYSTQAPKGMIRITISEIKAYLKQANAYD